MRPATSSSTTATATRLSWVASLVGLLLLSGKTATGQEICSCAPIRYTFTLDFGLTCPPVNVTRNGGIAATFCQVSPFGDPDQNITDLIPVQVGYVDVLELGQAFDVLSQQNITGTFSDGDTFTYTSVVFRNESLTEFPKVIQLNIFAFNAAGQPIVNFFAIAFTNNCFEFPVLLEGDSAGWTEFTALDDPSADTCPAAPSTPTTAPPPTEAPTAEGTTVAPTTLSPTTRAPDTETPTAAEPVTAAPTITTISPIAPTNVPVDPTEAPVDATEEPTGVPIEPTEAPVSLTDAPTEATASPTDTPVAPPSDIPITVPPSAAPVTPAPVGPAPTDAPETEAPTFPEFSMSMSMSMPMMMEPDYEFGMFEIPMDMISMSLGMSLSLSMSMEMDLPTKREKSAKRDKVEKTQKADTSKSKKADTSKASKVDTAPKSDKADASSGDGKRRRRLRLHRVD